MFGIIGLASQLPYQMYAPKYKITAQFLKMTVQVSTLWTSAPVFNDITFNSKQNCNELHFWILKVRKVIMTFASRPDSVSWWVSNFSNITLLRIFLSADSKEGAAFHIFFMKTQALFFLMGIKNICPIMRGIVTLPTIRNMSKNI